MSLQVWLPLTEDLRNQGLSNVTVTNNGATFNSNGKLGGCYTGRITVSSSVILETLNNTEFTVAFWIYIIEVPTVSSEAETYVMSCGSGGTRTKFHIAIRQNGAGFAFCFYGDDYTFYNTVTDKVGKWMHVVCEFKDNTQIVYVDGSKVGQRSTGGGLNIAANSVLNIYAAHEMLNDFRIYDHALSAKEINILSRGLVCHYPLSGPTPEQFFGDITEDNTIYSIRQSPNKHGAYDSIVGASVGWNQLMNPRNITFNNVTFSVSNGKYTISGTCNNSGGRMYKIADEIEIVANHKYLVKTTINMSGIVLILSKQTDANTYTWSGLSTNRSANIINPTFSGTCLLGANLTSGTTYDTNGYINLYDLTAMFGTAIADRAYTLEQSSAGSGVTWLKSHGFFTEDYYPYNPGQIKNVEGLVKREITGFNQWDGQWEVGELDPNTGENKTNSARSRSKNFIPVVPDTVYYHYGTPMAISLYDQSKKFIRQIGGFYEDREFTTPSNCYYIKFFVNTNTMPNNICINISDSSKNGTYEPYVSHSYSYTNPPTLRGVYKLDANNNIYADGDIWDSNGSVSRRYAVVDLGTLNWVIDTTGISPTFWAYIPLMKKSSPNGITSRYTYLGSVGWNTFINDTSDKIIALSASTGSPYVMAKDSLYTDAATFKTAMRGVYLLYELATPTTETSTTFTNPQIYEPGGVESYSFTGVIPPGHATKYVDVGFEGGVHTYEETLTNMGVNDNTEYDVSGYMNNGTKTGTITYSSDAPRYDMCEFFDGSSYISTSAGTFNWFDFSECTISVWMKPTYKPSGYSGSVGISHDYANNNKAFALVNHAGNFVAYYNNTSYSYVSSGYTLPLNEWHHCAATLDGTTVKVYVDGVLKNTVTIDWSAATSGAGQRIQVGVDYPGTDEKYTGYYSDVRIYTTALSDDDIRELYNTPVTLTSNGTLLTQGEIVES